MAQKRRILIVDPSRVARAALVKHLRDDFEIREESDGQAAWQSLVLDASIAAVVACLNLDRLNAYELLSKLRENRLQRLHDMPFILLISQDAKAEEREQAKAHGVNDFIVRGMSGDDIRRRIDRLVNWDIAATATSEAELDFPDPRTLTAQLTQTMAKPASGDIAPCSIVAFGLSHADSLSSSFGAPVVEKISRRIAQLIREKIRSKDTLGRLGTDTFLIISPGTPLDRSSAFAQRICRALAGQNVQIGQQRVHLETCMGIASLPADNGLDASQLIELAHQRLTLARRSPGTPVVSGDTSESNNQTAALISQLLEQLKQSQQIGLAGLQMMPLLQLLEKQFHFGLPLQQMEALFQQNIQQSTNEPTKHRET